MEFEEYFKKIDIDKRSIQGESGRFKNWPTDECSLGIPSDDLYGRNVLRELPDGLEGLHIYLGSDCEKIISSLTNSKIPNQLERLSIGDSRYALGSGRNYDNLTKILGEIEFPNLKTFEYDVWQCFSNSHCLFGRLGDVTGLLSKMPNLECLSLYGNFELSNPLEFSKLRRFNVTLDDHVTGINSGCLSQNTINNLLNANYPLLDKFLLDLDCKKNQYGYKFTEHFLGGKKLLSLKNLEITGGFLTGEKKRLLDSPVGTRPGNIYHLGDMSVS